MPDPNRATISATEASALFNANPYVTRWMLWQRFANGLDIDQSADNRMDWGKRMELLVLAAAAEDLKLEVVPNRDHATGRQHYMSRGPLGCSRDAAIICPDRGPGALETKCVFDYRSWMENWAGGEQPPRQYEIQLQVQMYVGDGAMPFDWGVIAAWVCGEMFYFERAPMPDLWEALEAEAEGFFADLHAGREPNPFGSAVEMPLMRALFTPRAKTVLDLRERQDAMDVLENARMYVYHRDSRLGHAVGEQAALARLRATIKGNEELLLPHGANVRQSKSGRVKVYVPDDVPQFERVEL